MSRGARAETLIVSAVLETVAPLAIEAALQAQIYMTKAEEDRRQLLELELKQAEYDATLAERRYAACDPSSRLIAATLENRWEEALSRVQIFKERMAGSPDAHETFDPGLLNSLAHDLKAAWDAPTVSMRVRQRLLQTLIEDIVAPSH